MKMLTYLNFAGTCAEAFRFYEQHLGGQIGVMMTHGQTPGHSPVGPEWQDAILHARITIGGSELYGADIPHAQPMRSAYLTLNLDSDAEAERVFAALSEGGEIFMPIGENFFASRFAQLQGPVRHQLDDRARAAQAPRLVAATGRGTLGARYNPVWHSDHPGCSAPPPNDSSSTSASASPNSATPWSRCPRPPPTWRRSARRFCNSTSCS